MLNYEETLGLMRLHLPHVMLPANATALQSRRANGWGPNAVKDKAGKGRFTWRYVKSVVVSWCIDQQPEGLRATLTLKADGVPLDPSPMCPNGDAFMRPTAYACDSCGSSEVSHG